MASDSLTMYVGLRFMPSDQELLLHYLYNKLHGQPYFQGAVFDFDLYGGNEPWEFWESFRGVDGQDLYFFTKLKRSKTSSGRSSAHINRKVGLADGTWSGENSATSIFAIGTNDEIGYCKRFRYENIHLPEHHGEWIMHEYSLHKNFLPQGADDNYVLCRIRKNERPKRKAKKSFSRVQPGSHIQTVVAPKMINNEGICDAPYVPEMTALETTTNEGTSGQQWRDQLDFSGMDGLTFDVEKLLREGPLF